MSEPTRTILRRDAPTRRSTPSVAPEMPGAAPAPAPPQPRRPWKVRLATAVVCLGLVIYVGQERRPIGPSAGPPIGSPEPLPQPFWQPVTVRLGTYNIHGGKGTDGRGDLGRIADMLRGVDFAGLNEVHGPALYEKEDQAAALGRMLELEHLFAPTEERWWHLKFGNGFLTNFVVEDWQVVPLKRQYGKSYRNYVRVRARAENKFPLNILVAHIDRSDDRERHEQLRTVANQFLALQPPAVLMGDLNCDASDDEIARLLGTYGVVDALGKKYGLKKPRHIDWIFVRGCEVVDAGITNAGPSDHPHVWADVSFGGINYNPPTE